MSLKLFNSSATLRMLPHDGLHDHLKLPSGKTLGETATDDLRRELARLGIADAHTAGRHIICERYAAMLMEVGERASEKAIAEFLESKRG